MSAIGIIIGTDKDASDVQPNVKADVREMVCANSNS